MHEQVEGFSYASIRYRKMRMSHPRLRFISFFLLCFAQRCFVQTKAEMYEPADEAHSENTERKPELCWLPEESKVSKLPP